MIKQYFTAPMKPWVSDSQIDAMAESRKIRVNVINPGCVPTEGCSDAQGLSKEQIEVFLKICEKQIPCGRVGTSEDIGDAVVFFMSEASGLINGVNLVIDGGQTQAYAGELD